MRSQEPFFHSPKQEKEVMNRMAELANTDSLGDALKLGIQYMPHPALSVWRLGYLAGRKQGDNDDH